MTSSRYSSGCRPTVPRPSSNSGKLWRLRRAASVTGHNRSRETLLEKAVAMLACNGHMPGWFNQCPVASGIGDSTGSKRRCIDLVHWRGADSRLSLVELKWDSDTPSKAVRQILRYGAAYLFCRTYRERLPVGKRRAMSATHVALRVAAPGRYYADDGFSGLPVPGAGKLAVDRRRTRNAGPVDVAGRAGLPRVV